MHLHQYIKRCREKQEAPGAFEILRILLSEAYSKSIVYNLFRFEAPAPA